MLPRKKYSRSRSTSSSPHRKSSRSIVKKRTKKLLNVRCIDNSRVDTSTTRTNSKLDSNECWKKSLNQSTRDLRNEPKDKCVFTVKQKVDNPKKGPICYKLDAPDSIQIKRRNGEGRKPVFDHPDIVVNSLNVNADKTIPTNPIPSTSAAYKGNQAEGANKSAGQYGGRSSRHRSIDKERKAFNRRAKSSSSSSINNGKKPLNRRGKSSSSSSSYDYSSSDSTPKPSSLRKKRPKSYSPGRSKHGNNRSRATRSKSRSRSREKNYNKTLQHRKYSRRSPERKVLMRDKEKIPYFANEKREEERRERLLENELRRRRGWRDRSRDSRRSRSRSRERFDYNRQQPYPLTAPVFHPQYGFPPWYPPDPYLMHAHPTPPGPRLFMARPYLPPPHFAQYPYPLPPPPNMHRPPHFFQQRNPRWSNFRPPSNK